MSTFFDREIRLGIAKPEKEPASVNEMRLAIDRAGRDCHLIRQAMDAARYQGMSGEDTYVMMAYSALRALEQQYRLNMQWRNCTPNPSAILNGVDDGR